MIIEKAPVNPYAPPQAALDTTPGLGCTRDGKVLIVPAGASLPPRCVKCNQPAIMDKPRTFTWHSPGWYLLILLAILIYVIVGMIVRKKMRLAIGLCEAHRARRRTLNLTGAGLFVAGLGALFAGIDFEVEALGWIGALALLASVIVALFAASGLSVARIDDGQARFRGCGKAFLDSLPQG